MQLTVHVFVFVMFKFVCRMQVLDSLDSIGEAEMLRRLEESIWTGNVPSVIAESSKPKCFVEPTLHSTFLSSSDSHKTVFVEFPSSDSTHMQSFRATLFKDLTYDDFGFSICQGIDGEGSVINTVRRNGPADQCSLKAFDNILSVSKRNKTYLCDLAFTIFLLLTGKRRGRSTL